MRPEARMAYEAHRQEDRLLIAVNHYIRDEIGAMRKVVAELRLGAIVRSHRVERWRLLVLFVVVVVLSRMPRSGAIAQLAYRRWHVRRWRNRA